MPRILTHKGFKKYHGLNIQHDKSDKVKLEFDDGTSVICTEDHKLLTKDNKFVTAQALQISDKVYNNYCIANKSAIEKECFVYDILEVEDTHSYFANNKVVKNCIFLDEFAFVQHSLAEDFFRATYPVISSGKTTKVIIVSTPNGLNLFYKMWMDAIEKRSTYVPYSIHWSQVPGRDAKWMEETIKNTSPEAFEVEFNCEFLGSTSTLIAGSKLRTLAFKNPILSEDGFDIYEHPQPDRNYVCIVDCSEGLQQDYSTINVVDITQIPYVQVAKYRDNETPLMFLPNTIYSIGMRYNEAFVLVETNSIGQQVVDILHYELEYENIYRVDQHHIKGLTVSPGFKKNSTIGIRTTKSVKKIGCATLKTLIESDKLIINDFDTISELSSFVRVRDSYAAEEGRHDDLVMGLVLFAWLSSQTYFKDTTNNDIRKLLLEEHNLVVEESLTPVGFIDDGREATHFSDGQDIWYFHLPNT